MGLRPRGLAHLPRRPPRPPVAGRVALRAPPAARRRRRGLRRRQPVGAPARYQARVTLHVPAGELGGRALLAGGTVEAIDDRTCELRTSDDSLDWLAVRVAMLGVDFEVHEPPELVARMRDLAARFERAAAPRGGRRLRRYRSPFAEALRLGGGADGLGPDLAPSPALLAMALDLAGELLLAQVDRMT